MIVVSIVRNVGANLRIISGNLITFGNNLEASAWTHAASKRKLIIKS